MHLPAIELALAIALAPKSKDRMTAKTARSHFIAECSFLSVLAVRDFIPLTGCQLMRIHPPHDRAQYFWMNYFSACE
jgi:hypothetical protein